MAARLGSKTAKPRGADQTPGIGDNSEADAIAREALFQRHLHAARAQNKLLNDKMAELTEIRTARRKVRALIHDDGFPLAKIDDILKREGMSQKDLQAEADLFRWMDQQAGLPVGGQSDLFATTPLEVRDASDFDAEGYRAGLRGETGVPPSTVPPRFVQDWMKGWNTGQERLAWSLAEKGYVVDRDPTKAASPVPLDPEPDDEVFQAEYEGTPLMRSASELAGWKVFPYEDNTWGVENPVGVEVFLDDRNLATEAEAWAYADELMQKVEA